MHMWLIFFKKNNLGHLLIEKRKKKYIVTLKSNFFLNPHVAICPCEHMHKNHMIAKSD